MRFIFRLLLMTAVVLLEVLGCFFLSHFSLFLKLLILFLFERYLLAKYSYLLQFVLRGKLILRLHGFVFLLNNLFDFFEVVYVLFVIYIDFIYLTHLIHLPINPKCIQPLQLFQALFPGPILIINCLSQSP